MRRGEFTYAEDRRQISCGPGDVLVHDSSRPFALRATSEHGPVSAVGIEIPKAMVALPRDRVDRVSGLRADGRAGMGALLAGVLTQLATEPGSYRPADTPRLAVVATELVTALFAHALDADAATPPPESHRTVLTLRIKAFIREHLGDPGLTRDTIAAAHHISTSYLHRLFQDDSNGAGPGVTAWIRHQRLEAARRDLADPAWNDVPIHRIAARWGFTRHADFTRAFRGAYRMPPREHRRIAQGTSR